MMDKPDNEWLKEIYSEIQDIKEYLKVIELTLKIVSFISIIFSAEHFLKPFILHLF